jgi:ankyrin repeat protein
MTNLEDKIIKFLDLEKNTLLHIATTANDIELVKELVANGADIDAINRAGQSILTIALNLKDKTLIKDYFPTLNFKESTKNTLTYYINASNVALLEPYQLDPKKVMNQLNVLSQKESELHKAVETYSVPLIEKLLNDGSDPYALYYKKHPIHHVYNYTNKKKITATDLIAILKLFKKHDYDESIHYPGTDYNLAEYIMHQAPKKSSKVFEYLLKEGYDLDLMKPNNAKLLTTISLSDAMVKEYFFDKITKDNYTAIPINTLYWCSNSLTSSKNKEISVKVLEKIMSSNWDINYDLAIEPKEYKTNASFYFNLIINNRNVPNEYRLKYNEFLTYFADKIDLNQTIKHTHGFSREERTSSIARIIFEENLHYKVNLPLEKINFNDEVAHKKGSIASKLIEDNLKAYREENIDKYLSYFDFKKANSKGETIMHEVLSCEQSSSINIERLSTFLMNLLENNTIDLTQTDNNGNTVMSLIEKFKFPKQFFEKLSLTNMTSINTNSQEGKKLKI